MKEYRETGIQDRFQDRVHEEPPQSDASGALRRAKEFAEMIVDSVREGLLVLDLDLRVEAANQSFYDHFHVKPYETVGRLVYDLGGGQWDIPELRRLLEEILPERKVMDDYEVTYDFEGLGEREMLLNARQVDDHELILLAIEDVTERRETARALRRSEKRYRTALRNSPVVFARVDDALRYEWIFNPHPDFDPSVTIGKRDDELASGPGIDALVALKRRVFETGKQERQEITFVRSDGPRTYDITATPVRDSSVRRENGQVQRLVTASLDVTERKLAEEELQALNETLEKRVEERT
jgi:PAS domain-containing protein